MKKVLAAVLFLMISLTYGTVSAQERHMHPGMHEGPPHRPGHGPGHHRGMWFGDIERMKEVLNLTDSQVQKIGAINLEHKKKLLQYKEEMAPKKIHLKRLLLDDPIDLGKVEALLREISDIKIKIRLNMIKHRIDIEKILTPEQRAKLRTECRALNREHDGKGIR